MSLKGIAKETLGIIDAGSYISPSGKSVLLRSSIDHAIENTLLYRPDEDLDAGKANAVSAKEGSPFIEVTNETTAEASRRLIERDNKHRVVALNFASAKNPGGGFLGGAKAQEEDLARCSALYSCLITQRAYYDENRAYESLLYTDNIIYSPDVPFFRDESMGLLEKPFLVSIITAPAPNAGELLRRDKSAASQITETLQRRSERVLSIAAKHAHRNLVLGAWGCGVFRNNPAEVAGIFSSLLQLDSFASSFDQITFAIYDRSANKRTLRSFEEQFSL